MTKDKSDPQLRAKLLNDILEADKRHKVAIKWLMDINTFFNLFGGSADVWKGDMWADLARVASLSKEDAAKDVIKTREQLDAARKRLEKDELDGYF